MSSITSNGEPETPSSQPSPSNLTYLESALPVGGDRSRGNNFQSEENQNSVFTPFLQQFAREGNLAQVGQVPEIERSLSQQFRNINVRAKFILPLFLLLLVKYLFDNFQCFLLAASLAITNERAKSLLHTQFALKDKADINQLLYAIIFSFLSLFVLIKILPQLDYKESLPARLLLFWSKKSFPSKLPLLQVIWDCYLTDWIVQLSFNTLKAVLFLMFLQKDRIVKLFSSFTSLGKSVSCRILLQEVRMNVDWFRRAGRKVRLNENKVSETVDLENQSNPLLASGLTRRGSRSHRDSNRDEQQIDDDTTETSEVEDPHRKIARMRLLSLFDIIVYMYRSLLPVPVWIYYLSYEGSTFQTFSIIYLAVKLIDYSWKFKGTIEAVEAVLGRKLEFGHYSTTAEYNSLTCTYDCPICFDSPKNAVTLDCQHIFCEACIYEWLDKEKTCPVCRKEIDFSSSTLHTLKQEVHSSRHLFV